MLKVEQRRGKCLVGCQRCYKLVNPTDPAENKLRFERNAAHAATALASFPVTRTYSSLHLEVAELKMKLDSVVSKLEAAQSVSDDDRAELEKVRKHFGSGTDLDRGIKNSLQRDRDRKRRIVELRSKVRTYEDLKSEMEASASILVISSYSH